jgi:hypothetical protein
VCKCEAAAGKTQQGGAKINFRRPAQIQEFCIESWNGTLPWADDEPRKPLKPLALKPIISKPFSAVMIRKRNSHGILAFIDLLRIF